MSLGYERRRFDHCAAVIGMTRHPGTKKNDTISSVYADHSIHREAAS